MIGFFNRTNQSISVSLRDGTTGFVVSKGVLQIEESQVSADILVKVKKRFLVRMPQKTSPKQVEASAASKEVDSVMVVESTGPVLLGSWKAPEPIVARSDLDAFLDEQTRGHHDQ